MIHIHLTPHALNQTRLTYSPLIEVMMSYRLLNETTGVPAHQRWADETKRALHGVSLPLMDSLLLTPHYVPDFVSPTPDHFETDIECDLHDLLYTPPHLVEKYLTERESYFTDEDVPAIWTAVASRPSAYLPELAEEIRLYWSRAIAPHWPSLISIIEGDIMFRARQLALGGAHRLLNDLNKRAVFDGSLLRLDKGAHLKKDAAFTLDDEGLNLVPSVFAGMSIMWQIASDYKPMMIYGARGVGTWQHHQPELDESLELLLGAGRASVLQDLVGTPATTTELAHHLHLTAGAVSQHLTILHKAGLVSPQRSGKRVYYTLSNKGEALVRLFR